MGSKTWTFTDTDPIVGFYGEFRKKIGIDNLGVIIRHRDCAILKPYVEDKS